MTAISDYLTAKSLLPLVGTVILGSDSHGTHGDILLSWQILAITD
jgi:hypothetical protein